MPDTEGHFTFNSMTMKGPEQAHAWRWKADQWLPGEWGVTAHGAKVFFWDDRNLLDLYRGDGCTTL